MRTHPTSRQRVNWQGAPFGPAPTQQVVSGLARVLQAFGIGTPATGQSSSPQKVEGAGMPYAFYEGDIFQPGAENWVFEPQVEGPLMTIWGHAFLRNPNTFRPEQPPQIYSNPSITNTGVGGLVAGQIAFQPITEPTESQQ